MTIVVRYNNKKYKCKVKEEAFEEYIELLTDYREKFEYKGKEKQLELIVDNADAYDWYTGYLKLLIGEW